MSADAITFFPPMECMEVEQIPAGAEWQYELKLDGYRSIAARRNGDVRLYSRRGNDFLPRFPKLADALAELSRRSFVLDGEIIASDPDGRHSFSLLQHAGLSQEASVSFFIFDVLSYRGRNLLALPLAERREILEREFATLPDCLRLSPLLHGEREVVLEKVREFGFEGVIAKRRDSVYESGERPGTWQKKKTQLTDDFVIGGYTGSGTVDELLIGQPHGKELRYMGMVRSGFVPATRRKVFDELQVLRSRTCPFANLPERKGRSPMTEEKMESVRWLRPVAICELAFNEITTNGRLRHSRFLRLRDDT